MRKLVVLTFASLLASIGTADAVKPPPISREAASCDAVLNLIDTDPKGTNVRAVPNLGGKVVAVLEPGDETTSVRVVEQRGDWMRIDRADTTDETHADGERRVFDGDGWIHKGLLGVAALYVGGGTSLRQRPDADAPVLLRLDSDDTRPARLLGCSGRFIRVRYGETIGWTDRWCRNERTTCS